MPAGRTPKLPDRKLGSAALRRLARAHTEAAVQVLAEVATKGNSEASRISAAMALLDRGYGKTGSGMAGDSGTRGPTVYHRIELIDGTSKDISAGDAGAGHQDDDGQD